jgi:hypothetical protein
MDTQLHGTGTMKNKLLCLLVSSAAGLAGCQTMGTGGGMMGGGMMAGLNPDCPIRAGAVIPTPLVPCVQGGLGCNIGVVVVTGSSGACEVRIATETLKMMKNSQNPTAQTEIYWWLANSPTWEFRADTGPFTSPIIFKDGGASSQFSPSTIDSGGRATRVMNRNQDSKEYKYKVRVYKVGVSEGPLDSPDPSIFNDFN